MLKSNICSVFLGYAKHLNQTTSTGLIRSLIRRSSCIATFPKTKLCFVTDDVRSRHWAARVGFNSCQRFYGQAFRDGHQLHRSIAEEEEFDDDSEGISSFKKPSTNESCDDSEVAGEWSQSPDVRDEALGDFSRFRLTEPLISSLKAKGIPYLFPVQMSTFDPLYDGYDVIVQARTGSGKTLSFAIPLIEKLHQNKSSKYGRAPKLLVMAPTRELARQVAEVMEELSKSLSVVCVYGGASINPQAGKIRNGVDVVVGTPGRIQDLIERGMLNLKSLEHVVLDEVDRMLDMGFADDVEKILKERYIPGNADSNPQTLLFSATVPSWVQKTAKKYLRNNLKKLDLVGDGSTRTATTVDHYALECHYSHRSTIVSQLLKVYGGKSGRSIIFCETKREADQLAASGFFGEDAQAIHGDVAQHKRETVLQGFRDGRYKCLVATDVAARGLDIPEVDVVIQFCPPKDVDSYIHRSGRTGRAGRSGVSILLHKSQEFRDIAALEKTAGFKFTRIEPPKAAEVLEATATNAAKSLEGVPAATVEKFTQTAETLITERGAVPSLAAALAVIAGAAGRSAGSGQSRDFNSPRNYENSGHYGQSREYRGSRNYENSGGYGQSREYRSPRNYENSNGYGQSREYRSPRNYENSEGRNFKKFSSDSHGSHDGNSTSTRQKKQFDWLEDLDE